MASKAELDRLDRLLASQEKVIRDAFRTFIMEATDDRVIQAVADRIDAGDLNGAMTIADSYIAQMATTLPAIFQTFGAATAVELAALIPDGVSAISFDPTWPRAAEIMRSRRLEFINEFTEEQRTVTRAAMTGAFETGQSTIGAARAFRDSMGLTQYQQRVIADYADKLRVGSADALQAVLRDRRFDRTVEASIRSGEPLTEKQIGRMVDRYRARWRIYRSEVIARTEAVRTMSEAREESLQQTLTQTGIPQSEVEREWHAIIDGRTRNSHAVMNGQKRGINERFLTGANVPIMYPGDPAAGISETAQCRCMVTFIFKTK